MILQKLFVEDVLERLGPHVIASKIRPATPEDVQEAAKTHAAGACLHKVVYDIPGFPYDARVCHTCGAHLGYV